MKNSIFKENFMATNFVKPLYKVKFVEVRPKLNVDRSNLVGNALSVTNNVSNIAVKETQKYKVLPAGCKIIKHYDLKCDRGDIMANEHGRDFLSDAFKAFSEKEGSQRGEKRVSLSDPYNMDGHAESEETYLRVTPAPDLPGESRASILFRYVACQLGVTVVLVAWTGLWVAVIYSYEGPHEQRITEGYEAQQNQLVVDLATELRTITPISPTWHNAIFTRIKEARRQTMIAAGKGAKLEPGRYWSVAGTFLFTVFVMTALGFGAPVPQTTEGRCFGLLYAVVAVPSHVYLMMQASTCAVAHVNFYLGQCQKKFAEVTTSTTNKGAVSDLDLSKLKENAKETKKKRKKMRRIVDIITAGHCVPIASILYYVCGVVIFGLGRYSQADTIVDILMFPLRFTTNGGLASVESHFRVLYGLYVEGAMALLTCTLAAVRRYSGNSVNNMTKKYRLFTKG